METNSSPIIILKRLYYCKKNEGVTKLPQLFKQGKFFNASKNKYIHLMNIKSAQSIYVSFRLISHLWKEQEN